MGTFVSSVTYMKARLNLDRQGKVFSLLVQVLQTEEATKGLLNDTELPRIAYELPTELPYNARHGCVLKPPKK